MKIATQNMYVKLLSLDLKEGNQGAGQCWILLFCVFWYQSETSMQGQDLLDEVSKTHEAIK